MNNPPIVPESGDGWSARQVDAILHGCLPVVIMDNVRESFEGILDWGQFGIRIREADIERIPELLTEISAPKLKAMQAALEKVWHRSGWADFLQILSSGAGY